MATATISMHRVSAFIAALANGISDDLREHVAPDKLQHEVERELEKQILAQTVRAISEYESACIYSRDNEVVRNAKRKQCLRMMGYCSEMWVTKDAVRAVLAPPSDVEEGDYRIFGADQ